MRLRRSLPEFHGEGVNVTPLIDVVMVLIIFYLLVGRLAMDRATPVRLPDAAVGLTGIDAEVITIELPADGGVIVDGVPVASGDLAQRLREVVARTPGAAVQLRADRAEPFERLRPVLDAAREAGLPTLRLAVARAEGKP